MKCRQRSTFDNHVVSMIDTRREIIVLVRNSCDNVIMFGTPLKQSFNFPLFFGHTKLTSIQVFKQLYFLRQMKAFDIMSVHLPKSFISNNDRSVSVIFEWGLGMMMLSTFKRILSMHKEPFLWTSSYLIFYQHPLCV